MSSKIRFVTIGYIEWRKGQDLLLDAIEQLPSDVVEKSEFILVGQKTSQLAQKLEGRLDDMPSVKMPGILPREEIHSLLESTDVLICPSREDPMPTVCAEAMMHRVPCLVSDVTGTSAYIKDGYDGLIFKSDDVLELKDKICWCVSHSNELRNMGDRSYEIYDNTFSPQVFENSLLKYVEDMIGKP